MKTPEAFLVVAVVFVVATVIGFGIWATKAEGAIVYASAESFAPFPKPAPGKRVIITGPGVICSEPAPRVVICVAVPHPELIEVEK